MKEYSSLIVAGLGSVGRGLLKIAGPYLDMFDTVTLIDIRQEIFNKGEDFSNYHVVIGDINDSAFIRRLFDGATGAALFINLCDGVDTVRLRRVLAAYPIAYIDAGAGCGPHGDGSGFSELMSYTNSSCHNGHPHLVCQGINPGMVEIIARRIIRGFPAEQDAFDIAVFEHDTLTATLPDGKIAVGWSPRDFVEEMMVLPAFEVIEGTPVEPAIPGSRPTNVSLEGRDVPSRIVAHEDIWNLASIPKVKNARFCYSLHDEAMELLLTTPCEALKRLTVPHSSIPVYGRDTVTVLVRGATSGSSEGFTWSVDHHDIWRRFGINGVQYQTAKGILFSLLFLTEGHPEVVTGTFNSATLPLDEEAWTRVDALMAELEIEWRHLGAP